mmetsp:Transcript_5927/g.20173  ORF Transcript_5927/g.20173 Transcript_5927/m.20173 type:complete len:524 (+) Transcript_5927:100-1671(+)
MGERENGGISAKHLVVMFAVIIVLFFSFDTRGLRRAAAVAPPPASAAAGEAYLSRSMRQLRARRARVFTLPDESPHKRKLLSAPYDIVMVGAGLSGGVLAERFARLTGARVLIIDRRDHIGGNCYDYIDEESGILVNKYGAHLFHTDLSRVWDYVTSMHSWERYDHQVLARVDGRLVPVPVNINTVNALLNLTIKDEVEMRAWLKGVQVRPEHGGEPRNSREMALSRVGTDLYKKIFEPYTRKQWDKDPSELAPGVTARIPVRDNFDNRYFSDRYQALPAGGYTAFFESLLTVPNVTVLLETDFFKVRPLLNPSAKIFYTGPIDAYFSDKGLGKLEYRSIRFAREFYPNHGLVQPVSVVNYPQDETECGFSDCRFTRVVEYKHYYNQKSPHSVTFREYSSDQGDPYYPVPNQNNMDLYNQFKQLAAQEKGVYFVGRLANYKYFNMDQAIDNALDVFAQTLCDVRPESEACQAQRAGTKLPYDRDGGSPAPAAPVGGAPAGGLAGGGGAMDKAVATAWRSPSDD